jgi:hypothetical protein
MSAATILLHSVEKYDLRQTQREYHDELSLAILLYVAGTFDKMYSAIQTKELTSKVM